MKLKSLTCVTLLTLLFAACNTATEQSGSSSEADEAEQLFPGELVSFTPYDHNPVFSGTGTATWDQLIRERGFVMKEDSTWYLWYTGYSKTNGDDTKYLGLATSPDGLSWKRFQETPIHTEIWVEDMFVYKDGSTYYMFAESRDDIAHLLTSTDKVNWKVEGPVTIRLKNGDPLPEGPYGTPTVWKEGDTWYLYYERNDAGVWLATSTDLATWTNVQDEPVIAAGPEAYDQYAVALNQIIRYKGAYYGYYHASAFEDWREWTMNIAVSHDLIHWEKYDRNPIMGNNLSSGMVVDTEKGFRFYTMHPEVNVFLPQP